MQDPHGPSDLSLNKLGKGLLGIQFYIPKYKHLSKVVLKKKIFEYFSMYFYGLNLGPQWRGHLESCGLDLNELGIRPQGNVTYQISSI